uniref:Hypotheticial protein n=1 Tax=Rodentolepis nana TaxID=102285 RepID=A0A0R3TTN5_RODNA
MILTHIIILITTLTINCTLYNKHLRSHYTRDSNNKRQKYSLMIDRAQCDYSI